WTNPFLAPDESSQRVVAGGAASVLHVDLLLAWIQVEAALDILGGGEAALEEARSRPPAYLSTIRCSAPDPSAPPTIPEPHESPHNISAPDSVRDVPVPPPSSSASVVDVTWEARQALIEEWERATPVVAGF